jgi:hypothetical protein
MAVKDYGEDEVARLEEHYRQRDEYATFHIALERAEAINVLAAWSPSGGKFAEVGIPDGYYGIVVVADGGNLYAAQEVPSC